MQYEKEEGSRGEKAKMIYTVNSIFGQAQTTNPILLVSCVFFQQLDLLAVSTTNTCFVQIHFSILWDKFEQMCHVIGGEQQRLRVVAEGESEESVEELENPNMNKDFRAWLALMDTRKKVNAHVKSVLCGTNTLLQQFLYFWSSPLMVSYLLTKLKSL